MKVCCCPVRPLLYTLAILGIVPSGAQILWTTNITREIVPIAYIVFNGFLMFAVYKKDPEILKWAQKLIICTIVASLIPILILPVVSASFVASGKVHFMNTTEAKFIEKLTTSDRFFNGTFIGFLMEVITFVSVGVEILKYITISRIWRLETEDQFANGDGFKSV